MSSIGTPLSDIATRVLLCGSGELGRELAIELLRAGVEVVVVDSIPHTPATHVAHRVHVVPMLDGEALSEVVVSENPDFIVPLVNALHAPTLQYLENLGYTVLPGAQAAQITWTREGIRRLAAEELGLETSAYAFADTEAEFADAAQAVGYPCIAKPVTSSTGEGVTALESASDLANAWSYTQAGGRAAAGRVIVEAEVQFDFEVVQLVVRHRNGTTLCEPIGHRQDEGEFIEAWQPHPMSREVLEAVQSTARTVAEALGGYGVFAVELFVSGDRVIFNTASARPHEAGLVTMVSQDLSQFALQVRAILGLPVVEPRLTTAGAVHVVLATGDQDNLLYSGLDAALAEQGTQLHLFGRNGGRRRVGAALARGATTDEARDLARSAASAIGVTRG